MTKLPAPLALKKYIVQEANKMAYLENLEYQKRTLENSLFNCRKQLRQKQVIIDSKDKRIQELETEISSLKKLLNQAV